MTRTSKATPVSSLSLPLPAVLQILSVPNWLTMDQANGYAEFKRALDEALEASGEGPDKSYVLLDAPREYAQNHSQVSALSDVLQTSLRVGASNGSVAGRGSIDSLRETQTLLHAIKRSPLLLAFGHKSSSFGWMLGPSFEIENFKPKFHQAAIHHSTSVQVVVPRFAASVGAPSAERWTNGEQLLTPDGSAAGPRLSSLPELWSEEVRLPAEIELGRFARNGAGRLHA